MHTLKTVIKTIVAMVVLLVIATLAFVFSGVYNVAASDPHMAVTHWLIERTVERSVALRADGIEVPPLSAHGMLLDGAASYEQMCSHCHSAPGAEPTAVAQGLNPRPPRLDDAAQEYGAAELFWIIKHGIKMTGMPAWGATHNDDQLWPIVAFVQRLPDMSPEKYRALLAAAHDAGAGHHMNHEPAPTADAASAAEAAGGAAAAAGDDEADGPVAPAETDQADGHSHANGHSNEHPH